MKKFTLTVHRLDDSVTISGLRTAVENVLLRLHPKITYRLGATTTIGSDVMLIEIAADSAKELLESHLKAIEKALPVTVERLGWGWIAEDVSTPAHTPPLRQDARIADDYETVSGAILWEQGMLPFRYLLTVSLGILLLALLVTRHYLYELLLLDVTYYAIFIAIVWLFLLPQTPLNIRLHAKKVECDQVELAVTYWDKRKTVRIKWETMWGLDYSDAKYTIRYGDNRSIRFFVHRDTTKTAIFEAIVHRAALNEVESGIGWALYRRYDAP